MPPLLQNSLNFEFHLAANASNWKNPILEQWTEIHGVHFPLMKGHCSPAENISFYVLNPMDVDPQIDAFVSDFMARRQSFMETVPLCLLM